MASISENLSTLQEKIAHCAKGKSPLLIAVSKTVGPDKILQAWQAGHRDFGENRVQELVEKMEQLKNYQINWHLIGHLQKNKVRHIVDRCALIHSVDSQELAYEIDKRAKAVNKILLQVNISQEEQKYGISCEDALILYDYCLGLKKIEVAGLMTIAPFTDDIKVIKSCFSGLGRLKDHILKAWPDKNLLLSMGMSQDWHIALEENADILRIGRAIFGD